MRLDRSRRAAILIAVLACTTSSIAAQSRLIALSNGLHELSLHPSNFGAVLATWPIPSNVGVPYDLNTFTLGRTVGWTNTTQEGELGVVVFDAALGTFTRIAITSDTWPNGDNTLGVSPGNIVGVSPARHAVILSARTYASDARRIIEWNASTRSIVRSVTLDGPCQFGHAYAEAAHRVFVVRADRCFFSVPTAQWVDIIDLTTGVVQERVFNVPYGYGQRFVTDANGTRLWVLTMDDGFGARAGVGVFDIASGRLLATNLAIRPERKRYPALFTSPAPNVVATVTADGLIALDGTTLQPFYVAESPRYRLTPEQIAPGHAPTFDFNVLIDAATRTVVSMETAGSTRSYHGGPCLQSTLVLLDPRDGRRVASRNYVDADGRAVCGRLLALIAAP